MVPRVAKKDVGDRLRDLRKALELNQTEAAAAAGVSQSQWSTWENEGWIPEARVEDVAKALELTPDELLSQGLSTRADASDYVSREKEIDQWRDEVLASDDINDDVRLMLARMKPFVDRTHWVVSTTPEDYADELNDPVGRIKSHWDEMLESPFVERVGTGEYTIALRFPEE